MFPGRRRSARGRGLPRGNRAWSNRGPDKGARLPNVASSNPPKDRRRALPQGRQGHKPVEEPAISQSVIAAPIVNPRTVSKIGYVAAARSWEPHVLDNSIQKEYVNKVLSKAGVLVSSSNCSVHKCQALERSLAVVETLAYLYDRGYRSVLNVYADVRESKFNDSFNRELRPGETPMRILRYCPDIVHKDRMRHPTNAAWSQLVGDADSLLYVDIYQQHRSQTSVFDPEYVARRLLELPGMLNKATLFWIGRKFFGDCGVVPLATLDEGKRREWAEGAWMRNASGKIQFKSSPTEGMEYEHDPCDWIWKSTSTQVEVCGTKYTLRWSLVRPVGSFSVISFGLYAADPSYAPSPWFGYQSNLIQLAVPSSNWMLTAVRSYIPQCLHPVLGLNLTLPVYEPYITPTLQYLANKRIATYHLTTVTNKLNEALSLKENNVLFSCFPELDPSRKIDVLAQACVSFRSQERLASLVDVTTTHGSRFTAINGLLSTFGTTPLPSVSGIPSYAAIAGMFLTAGGYILLRKYMLPVSSIGSVYQTYLNCRDEPLSLSPLFTTPPTRRWKIPQLPTLVVERVKTVVRYLESPKINWPKVGLTYVYQCVVAPYVEEFLKMSPLFYYTLPFAEFLMYSYQNPTYSNIMLRGVIFGLHYWFARGKDIHEKAARHGIYNFIAITTSIVLDPTVRQQCYYASLLTQYFVKKTVPKSGSIINKVVPCLFFMSVVAYNLYQFYKPKPADKFEQWRDHYYNTDWEERNVPDRSVETFSWPITNPRTPTSARSSVNSNVVESTGIKCYNWIPDNERAPTYFYQILPTCVPGYVPQVNYHNLNAAIVARMLVEPPLSVEEQRKNWEYLLQMGYFHRFVQVLFSLNDGNTFSDMSHHTWNECVDKWVEHFIEPDKKKKYQREVIRIRQGLIPRNIPKTTDVFLKSNEMLLQSKNGKMAMKPRFISNVDPWFQTLLGPYVYAAQKRMASCCSCTNENVFHDEKRKQYISICYGGSALDSELSTWMYDVINRRSCPIGENGISILVSGDDSYVAVFCGDKVIFIETDFSKYDSTQSFGPLLFQNFLMQRFYRVPKEVADALYTISGSSRMVVPRQYPDLPPFIAECSTRYFRHSGGIDTSIGNSTVTMFSWFAVYQMFFTKDLEYTEENIKDCFLKLGFEVTVKISLDPFSGTFLKGMWFPYRDFFVWAPLPSRFLKIGKCLKDPRVIFDDFNMESACLKFLNGVASTYAVYMQVPILRAFVNRYKVDKPIPNDKGLEFNPFAIPSSGMYRDLKISDEIMSIVCNRYGITEEDIYRVEALIQTSNVLTFLSDPVFVAMWEVDYA